MKKIDVVVNSAGYGLVGAFEELGTEQVARNFDTSRFIRVNLRFSSPVLG